jgi:hypothetical protein
MGISATCGKVSCRCCHESCGQFVIAFEVGSGSFPGGVDGVVPAEQDPVVVGQTVVVELVAGVSDALALLPPDGRPHVGGQGRGHQHVVEHRHDEQVQALEQRVRARPW